LKRIARGIKKFVINNPEPFIIPIGYGERAGQEPRTNSIHEPLGTVVSSNKHYIVAPSLIQYHSETATDEVRGQELTEPLMTVDTSPRYALSVAHIMKNYGGGYKGAGSAADKPLDTVTAKDHNELVTAHILTMRNHMDGQRIDEPLGAISCSGAHHAEVQAFLVKYFSTGTAKPVTEPLDTITTKERFGLVTIHGEDYIITDIRMRMLTPRELFRAQGFPESYIIDHDSEGRPYPKSKQVARCGNAVTPPVPCALVRANLPEMCGKEIVA
jgi:DNA (cytosine-5)-methyltransferase 1